MTIFHKWDDAYNYKGKMYVMVDNDYNVQPFDKLIELGVHRNILNFSEFSKDKHYDFVDNSSKNHMLYVAYRKHEPGGWNQPNIPEHFVTYIFIKNKFYDFKNSTDWFDEIDNKITSQHDIWYDPFLFVYEPDLNQAIRYLKLKNLKEN